MAKQRYVNTRFWDDTYISNLDPSEKLVFLYCLTNPATTICGIYEIPKKRIVIDTGFSNETIENILNRFSKDNKIHYIDGYIIIVNFIKHQSNSPKILRGIDIELEKIPDYLKGYGIDRVSDSNSNSNSNSNIKRHSKQFKKPSIDEIDQYLAEVKVKRKITTISFSGDAFFNYYESKGWMVGKNKMQCWKAAVNTWLAKEEKERKQDNPYGYFE